MGGLTMTIAMLLNIVHDDIKGRFQICAEVDKKGYIHDYFAVRAVSGHGIPWLDQRRIACPVDAEDLKHFGCITHVTTKEALIGIFRFGLIPGGRLQYDARSETNFGC